MKILWIAPIKHPGASGHPAPWIEQLAANIDPYIELTILGFSSNIKGLQDSFRIGGSTRIFLKALRPKYDILTLKLISILSLRNWLKANSHKFDLIHIHGNEHQFEVACNGTKMPKVLSIQGIISECLKYYQPNGFQLAGWKLSSWYELNYYQSVNNYSCRTHWDQAIVKRHNPRANVFEIWETIRPEFFIQKKTSKGENILFLGGTQAIKGIDYVLKSYDLIKNQISGKLMIAGNISLNKLHQIIKKYHLDIIIERDIKILGFLGAKDMVENARKSFCLLHPTLIDNSPNSVCESQVIGLPVVATEVGGVSSLIEDGDTGLLANHNCEKIATQVLKLYTDDDLWNYISIKSREVARKRHDPDKIVKQTLKMYEKIINENE